MQFQEAFGHTGCKLCLYGYGFSFRSTVHQPVIRIPAPSHGRRRPAVHIAFAKPPYLTRDEVPADAVEKERQALLDITKAEGKPEQAWPKIVEGRLNAWFKDQVLLEQGFVRDDKTSITQLLGGATIVRFAQVYIGS